jgi:FkbM family methyltransferase
MTTFVIALAVLIVVALALLIHRLRQVLTSVDGQLAEMRTSLSASDNLRDQEAKAANLRAVEIAQQIHAGVAALQAQLNGISDHLGMILGRVNDVSMIDLPRYTADLCARIAVLSDTIDIDIRKPLQSSPIDSALLEARTEAEVAGLALQLAILRPLVPYPKWRFDADLSNPDLSFHLRQRIWQYWSDRRVDAPLVLPWHGGTRLCVYLGNDLSRQIYVAGCIDPNEFAFLDRFLQPSMVLIDAGANEGIYTVFAAKRVGPEGTVWAFEPSRRELARLERNLELNNLSARIFPLALADYNGQTEMTIAGYGHEGQNTLSQNTFASIEVARKERIEVARLDDLVDRNPLPRLDLIKVDVEGAELRLLQGASQTLRRYRPVVLLEVCENSLRNQGSSREELMEFLKAQAYATCLFDPHTGLPTKAIAGAYGDNMLAVPTEMSLPDSVYRPWPEISRDATLHH